MKPKELYKFVHNCPNNYNMKKGNGVQDLKDFKKWLLFNSAIHVYNLIKCLKRLVIILFLSAEPISLGVTISYLIPTIINCYCIMLQRYNWIRIDKVIKKYSPLEKINRDKIKEEIKNEDATICNHKYKIINIFDKEKEVSLDNLLEKASLKELKNIRELLKEYKETIDDNDNFFYDYYNYGKEHHSKYITDIKRLVLEINHN